jgi:hypothetical protein
LKQVYTDRRHFIAWIKQDDVSMPLGRNPRQYRIDQVTVRVKNGNAPP